MVGIYKIIQGSKQNIYTDYKKSLKTSLNNSISRLTIQSDRKAWKLLIKLAEIALL